MVARQFARLGAGVLDADQAGHEVLRLPHVEAAVRQRWGAAVFGADGRIDRGGWPASYSPPALMPNENENPWNS